MEQMIYTTNFQSPIGNILLVAKENQLIGLYIEEQKQDFRTTEEVQEKTDLEIFKKTKDWLNRYFHGEQPALEELELNPMGSDFRKCVWKYLCKIPYGKTTTYKKLAEQVIKERGVNKMSAQAIGNAVGHNPISIIIPCHRVIGSNGDLTGYASGLEKKKYLLQLERIKGKQNG